jgi:hypothetical protein
MIKRTRIKVYIPNYTVVNLHLVGELGIQQTDENQMPDQDEYKPPSQGFAQMGGKADVEINGMYKAEEYSNLPVDKETKDLFEYITR